MGISTPIVRSGWFGRAKTSLRSLGKKQAWPPWILLVWSLVEKAGDLQFLVLGWPKVKAFLLPIVSAIGEWGWIPGIAWLGYLLVRPEKHKPQLEPQTTDSGQPTASWFEERIAKLRGEITENKREYDKKVVEWRQNIASAKNDLDKQHKENEALRNELQSVKKELRLEKMHSETRFYQTQYNIQRSRAFPEQLTELELVVFKNDLKLTLDIMDQAAVGLMSLARKLSDDMEGGDEASRVALKYYNKEHIRPTGRLYDRLCELHPGYHESNGDPFDYREWLMHYYVAYNELRKTVKEMVQIRRTQITEFQEYFKWKEADASFLARISNIPAMYDAITEVNTRHEYPVPMAN